jgi:phosphate starvation-inducible PhoH-like protein
MLMFLTRLGIDSRCVITGDPSQVDLKSPGTSGLREALEILPGAEGVAFVQFEKSDIVRHPVVQNIIDAFGRSRAVKGA